MHQMIKLGPFGNVLKSFINFQDFFSFEAFVPYLQSKKMPIFDKNLQKFFVFQMT